MVKDKHNTRAAKAKKESGFHLIPSVSELELGNIQDSSLVDFTVRVFNVLYIKCSPDYYCHFVFVI